MFTAQHLKTALHRSLVPQGKTFVTRLIETMKEHKGSVNFIRVTRDDRRCVSASSDGTCIICDLQSASLIQNLLILT